MNGYDFTERVRKVLALGRQEALALGHQQLDAEHELLGLLAERDGVGATVADAGGAIQCLSNPNV